MTRIPVQIVFQGGGAKLCALMAVCDALKSNALTDHVSIRAVGGSSAGAIAAVMLACPREIAYYKDRIYRVGKKHLKNAKTSQIRGAVRVIRGHAYFRRLDLHDLFNDLFCQDGGPRHVRDLPISTSLYYTDLYSLASRVCQSDDAIPHALAKSCNFPLAFVGFGSNISDIDGGLAQLLPVDKMKAQETTQGRVIGISFSADFGKGATLFSYVQLLFSAAMQSGVARSQDIIHKENIYEIATNLGTFDFERALDYVYSNEYNETKYKFTEWCTEWLKQFGEPAPMRGIRFMRPHISPSLPRAILAQINDDIESNECTRTLFLSVIDIALLDRNGIFTGRYRSRIRFRFCAKRPLHLIQFKFSIGSIGSYSAANPVCGISKSNGDALIFDADVQEVTEPGERERSFRLFLYFSSKITPDSANQPYEMDFECETGDPFPTLGVGPEFSRLFTSLGDAEELVIGAALPRSRIGDRSIVDLHSASAEQWQQFDLEVERDKSVPSQNLNAFELLRDHLDHSVDRYSLVARCAHNVRRGMSIGFLVE